MKKYAILLLLSWLAAPQVSSASEVQVSHEAGSGFWSGVKDFLGHVGKFLLNSSNNSFSAN